MKIAICHADYQDDVEVIDWSDPSVLEIEWRNYTPDWNNYGPDEIRVDEYGDEWVGYTETQYRP